MGRGGEEVVVVWVVVGVGEERRGGTGREKGEGGCRRFGKGFAAMRQSKRHASQPITSTLRSTPFAHASAYVSFSSC